MGKNQQAGVAENPYVGPVPFLEGQKLYGRESDVQALSDLLIAKRIVLLISPSGAGKTSLIQAALLPRIRKHFDALPIVRLDLWRQGGQATANRYVFATLQAIEERIDPASRKPIEVLAELTLAQYFRAPRPPKNAKGRTRFPLMVFDQFEELFTLDRSDWAAKKEFLRQLGELLGGTTSDPDEDEGDDTEPTEQDAPPTWVPPVWAIFSMREDHVAELEPYLDRLPTGLAFRYRLLPLEADQAIEAIHGPAGENFSRGAAAVLVDDLRRVFKSGVSTGEAHTTLGRFVEPLLLQVSCLRLWDQIVAGAGRPIGVADIASAHSISEVDAALADYFGDEVAAAAELGNVKQRVLRDFIEDNLLSRGGVRTKLLRDPAQLGELDLALGRLIARHILRTDIAGDRQWIELSHDRLVDPVCRSNQEWRENNLSLLQKQAKLWKESRKPQELLFSGEQLDEAERFAAGQASDLVDTDREFLAESKKERMRLLGEHRQRQGIAQMNQRLVKQRFALAACLVVAALAVVSLFAINAQLEAAKIGLHAANRDIDQTKNRLQVAFLDSRLKEAALLVRDENSAEGLRMLVETNNQIEGLGIKGQEAAVDMALVRVLGRFPPVEARLGQHAGIVKAIAFTRSGEHIVSGSWDGNVRLWPTANGSIGGQSLGEHLTKIFAVAYNQPAQLAVSADEGGTIVLWKMDGGNTSRAGQISWRIEVGAVAGSQPPATSESGLGAQITSLALNADGTLLAAASRNKRIATWDVANPDQPRPIASFGNYFHQTVIYQVGFIREGPDKGKLVSADWNGRVGIWSGAEPGSAQPAGALKTVEPVAIHALAISPNGRWIFAGDVAGDMHVWDVWGVPDEAGGRPGARIVNKQSRGRVNAMAFAADGNTLFSVGEDNVLIKWSLPANAASVAGIVKNLRLSRFSGWEEKLYSVATHPTRDGVVAIGGSKGVMLADTTRPNLLARPMTGSAVPRQGWNGLAASGDLGSIIALAADSKTVHWLKRAGEQYQAVQSPIVFDTGVSGLAATRSGSHFAVQTCSGEVQVRPGGDMPEDRWSIVGVGEGGPDKCPFRNSVAFAAGGTLLAAASGPLVRLWRLASPGSWKLESEKRFDQDVVSIAFNGGGDLLASGGKLNWIEVWRIAGNRIEQRAARMVGDGQAPVLALAFSADGRSLVSGTENPAVSAWALPDLKTRVSVGDLHERAVDNIVFGRRGDVQAMFSADREGRLVACFGELVNANCAQLGRPFGGAVNGMAISDNGTSLVVAGQGLFLLNLDRQDMLRTVRRLATAGR